jgi:hypothetical protein
MLVEAIKTALREQKKACSDKGAMRAKSSAVCSWLLDVACAGNNEPLHDEVLNLAEVKNGSRDLYFCKASSRNHAAFHHSPSPFAIHYALWYLISSCRLSVLLLHQYLELDDSLLESTFEPKPLLTPAEKAQVQIPNFVAALDGGGSAFMVHASVGGGAAFFCNDGMATHFVVVGARVRRGVRSRGAVRPRCRDAAPGGDPRPPRLRACLRRPAGERA